MMLLPRLLKTTLTGKLLDCYQASGVRTAVDLCIVWARAAARSLKIGTVPIYNAGQL